MTLDPKEIKRIREKLADELLAERSGWRAGFWWGMAAGVTICILMNWAPYALAAISYALSVP